MPYQSLIVREQGPVTWVTLNRSEVLNDSALALDREFTAQALCLASADAKEARQGSWRGAPPRFQER